MFCPDSIPTAEPQWSPVMKTGNTETPPSSFSTAVLPQWSPVMKTGNTDTWSDYVPVFRGLNGARS